MNMKLKTSYLPAVESIVYYICNIISLGSIWVIKIIIKKAINESNAARSANIMGHVAVQRMNSTEKNSLEK